MQGRVPQSATESPAAARGWTCNVAVVSHHDTPGGFRVWRYVDANGHACAFYDTSLSSAANVVSLAAAPTQGAVVLDMTDPAHPQQTDLLTAPAMLSPHESLNLNTKRGLLAAEAGTASTAPGLVSIYDVRADCRRPVLQSNYVAGPYGHESGFAPDGKTYWIGGGQGIIAVDVTDPKVPHSILTLDEFAHGLNLSDDGNTLYDTNAIDGGLNILDVSEVQARKPDPQVREISRLTWDTTSIPQNTNPMRIGGHPYLLEYDEFAFRFDPATIDDKAGAARIIDLADPKHPRVVSNLRLDVNMPANHKAADGDPNFQPGPALTYGAHYCAIPREDDPEIAACSFLNSGLRIFDIRDPLHPREAAYFISPPQASNGQPPSDQAFSQPAFDPATIDDKAGAARIIDLADPKHPRVVSNLRLEVNMPTDHKAADGDPNFEPGPALTYGAHYCAIPREDDPEIAACSFLNSGLRIFDIRDPLHPREAAYFISPPQASNGQPPSDQAFSQPAFDPARREVYYSDAASGFYDLRLTDAVWPHPNAAPRSCASRRSFTVHVRPRRHGHIANVTVTIAGKRQRVRRAKGRFVSTVRLTGRPRTTVHVRILVRTTTHRTYTDSRTYHPCRARGRG
jgi:hypothetical protein